jgi:hypothetical protein
MRLFKPHAQAEPPAQSGTGSVKIALEPVVPNFREEAAAYLEKRLEELLGIKPLLSIEQRNTPLQPTAERRGG